MKHKMNLRDAPFQLMKTGQKTIELRLYDEKRRQISVGDEIEFANSVTPSLTIRRTVVALHLFPSFNELYASLPLLRCGYTADELSTASPSDMDLYYSKQAQKAYGVVGIELK